jgi:ArsR family metal-binding transcriptional regulator
MHLLRHTWATTYANRVITQYEDGVITAEEYDEARERLCHLMAHSPEANEKYLNPLRKAE